MIPVPLNYKCSKDTKTGLELVRGCLVQILSHYLENQVKSNPAVPVPMKKREKTTTEQHNLTWMASWLSKLRATLANKKKERSLLYHLLRASVIQTRWLPSFVTLKSYWHTKFIECHWLLPSFTSVLRRPSSFFFLLVLAAPSCCHLCCRLRNFNATLFLQLFSHVISLHLWRIQIVPFKVRYCQQARASFGKKKITELGRSVLC